MNDIQKQNDKSHGGRQKTTRKTIKHECWHSAKHNLRRLSHHELATTRI